MSTTTQNNVTLISGPLADRPLASTVSQDGTLFRDTNTGEVYVLQANSDPSLNAWVPIDEHTVAAQDFVLYLNAVSGDDTHDGITPETAIQTIEAAKDRVPFAWRGKCRLNFAAGTYPWPATPGPNLDSIFTVGQATNPLGEPQAWVGSFSVVAGPYTNTVDDPNGLVITPGVTLTPGALRGVIVEVLTGVNAGQWASVSTNDATTITLAQPLFNEISIGDTVQMVTPAVVIDGTAATVNGAEITFQGVAGDACMVGFRGIKFVSGFQASSVNVLFDRCELDTVGRQVYFRERSRVDVGPFGVSLADLDVPGAIPACLYVHGTQSGIGGSANVLSYSRFTSPVVSDDTLWNAQTSSIMSFVFYTGENSPILMDASHVRLSGFSASVPGNITNVADGNRFTAERGLVVVGADLLGAVSSFNGADLEIAAVMDISNNGTSGFWITDHSVADFVFVTGSGNTGWGIRVSNQGSAYLYPGTVSVTGSSGDTALETTTHTYAAITGAAGAAISDVRLNVLANFV